MLLLWSLVLTILLSTIAQAFASAPVRWGHGVGFVVAPKIDLNKKLTSLQNLAITWDSMGWCLEASGDKSGDAVRVNQCTGGKFQKWSLVPNGHGQERIQLSGSTKCLESADEEYLIGAPFHLRECNDAPSESWVFEGPVQTGDSVTRNLLISLISIAVLGTLSLGAWLWRSQKHAEVETANGTLDAEQGGVTLIPFLARHHGSMDPPSQACNVVSDKPRIPVQVQSSVPAVMAVSPDRDQQLEPMTTVGPETSYIVPLDTQQPVNLQTVGGKGHSLVKLTKARFPVPSGFVLATSAYEDYVRENGLQEQIQQLAVPDISSGVVSFEKASSSIKALFKATIPRNIAAPILQAYLALGAELHVAVRSSATAEDLPNLSFAGQQDTYLAVKGEEALVEHVVRCWASLWTDRAMSYRHMNGISHADVSMAVVVQSMVASDISGVTFTANPNTGERSELIITASFGLGETTVSGEVTPDTYILEKDRIVVKKKTLGTKDARLSLAGDRGIERAVVSEADRKAWTLIDGQLSELAKLACAVEVHSGGSPQDIEWAFVGDKLWLLQSRNITSLPPTPLKDVKWEIPEEVPEWIKRQGKLVRRKLTEHIPGPVSPLFEDLYIKGAFREMTMNWMNRLEYQVFPPDLTINGFTYMTEGRPPLKPEYAALYDKCRNEGRRPKPDELPSGRQNPKTKKQIEDDWRTNWVPKYVGIVEKWKKVDLATASSEDLWNGMYEIALADAQYWRYGFLPAISTTRQSESGFQGWLETCGHAGFTSGMFLTGLKSIAMEAEKKLLAIARRARVDEVKNVVIATSAERLLPCLRSWPAAEQVVREIDAYLEEYGHEVKTLDFAEPTQIDDPSALMMSFKLLVQNFDTYDPATREKELTKKREEAFDKAIKAFAGEPGTGMKCKNCNFLQTGVVDDYCCVRCMSSAGQYHGPRCKQKPSVPEEHFKNLYNEAKEFYPLREESLFYVAKGWPMLRNIAAELGRRLVDVGTLGSAYQVYYLRRAELDEAITAQIQGNALPDLRHRAEEKVKLQQARARLRPPVQIPPPVEKSGGGGGAEGRTEGKFGGGAGMRIKNDGGWALGSVQMDNEEGNELEGFPCSPGVVTAPASVILSPADFNKMKPKTILVCPMTTPAWTNLFLQAAGLVTDVGGILSHGSIVAREYGIPAVLGTGDITERVEMGQMITVDGFTGVVTILDEKAE